MLNHNHDSVGVLLRGFFEYFAQNGQMSTVNNRGFDWGREVLSLRTIGGILTKQEKGWVGAKTVVETTTIAAPLTPSMATQAEAISNPEASPGEQELEVQTPKMQMKTMEETKEIRYRYLFAIEDPFELDHNVARTVTHNGIVSIRDEFRRAWRIIRGVGKTYEGQEGGLLDPVTNGGETKGGLQELLTIIHGPAPKGQG
jgi:DNA polymerase sigma